MRYFLRNFIFTLVSVLFTNYLVSSLSFGRDYINNLMIVVLALAFLFMFIRPLLKILSFPIGGPGFWVLTLLIISLVFYVLTLFLIGFTVNSVVTQSFNLIGFVVPSIHLDSIPALVMSSVLVFAFHQGLEWLCPKK